MIGSLPESRQKAGAHLSRLKDSNAMNDRHPAQPPSARPAPTRRAVLLGAGAALVVGLGGAAVSVGNALPGQRAALRNGTVDQSSAQWIAASAANYRYADRPDDYTIDRIVIHVTQSRFTAAARAFHVAYHAGNREWNERSIGIEHEGFVDAPDRWFTDFAYQASAELAADISARYDIPIDREHIVGHQEVPGATHTDPGPYWDWDRYLSLVRGAR